MSTLRHFTVVPRLPDPLERLRDIAANKTYGDITTMPSGVT